MAGLVPAIHVFKLRRLKDVDARDKRGHDKLESCLSTTSLSLVPALGARRWR